MAALNKANGRANVAIELVKPKGEIIAPGNSLPAGFRAPRAPSPTSRRFSTARSPMQRHWRS